MFWSTAEDKLTDCTSPSGGQNVSLLHFLIAKLPPYRSHNLTAEKKTLKIMSCNPMLAEEFI